LLGSFGRKKGSPKTLNAGCNLRFRKLWSEIPKSYIGHPVEGVAFDGGRVPGTARYRVRPAAPKRMRMCSTISRAFAVEALPAPIHEYVAEEAIPNAGDGERALLGL
jgi:hypothetical protein